MSRRKTLLGSELPQFTDDDNLDEEKEKEERRKKKIDAANLSTRRGVLTPSNRLENVSRVESDPLNKTTVTPTNGAPLTSATPNVPLPRPTNQQLGDLYTNCVKLLNENKINVKNAFQLKLIDYMSDIVLNKDIGGGTTNFQVVGCTIDVGTKIYAARVDALHQNTYKMLSGLGSSNSNQDGDGEGGSGDGGGIHGDGHMDHSGGLDGDDGDENGATNKKAKAKRKRLKKSSQIAENLDSISSKMRDDFKDEDTYFGKVSTCIENEAIAGMLSNKLRYADESLRVLINADDKLFANKENFTHAVHSIHQLDLKDIVEQYRTKSIEFKHAKLCSDDLRSFRFVGWNLDTNDEITKLVETIANVEEDSAVVEAHRFDANNMLHTSHLNASMSVGGGAHDLDVEAFSDMGMGGGGCDFESDHGDIESTGSQRLPLQPAELGVGTNIDILDDIRSHSIHSVAELTTLISYHNSSSDYSYFDLGKLRLHDLPKHLKTIAARLMAEKRNGGGEASNGDGNGDGVAVEREAAAGGVQRTRKEIPKIDFGIVIDRSKFFKVTKKATFLCDKTLEKRSEKPFRIETERQYDFNGKELFQPYFKAITAKIFSDVESVENLLIDDADLDRGGLVGVGGRNKDELLHEQPRDTAIDDEDPHFGMGGGGGGCDDFEMPCGTANTNEPFYSQNGGQFLPATLTQDNHNHNHHDIDMNMDGFAANGHLEQRFDGSNLIEAPMQVNVLNIEYAKTSKNIDVRRLKQVIWQLLCESSETAAATATGFDEDKENASNLDSTTADENVSKMRGANGVSKINASLKAIYKRLRPPLVTQKLFDDLSICIVFQMLLFLANEHNLLLKNDPLGSDVVITN